MDESLLQAYRDTDYLVCVDRVEWACIRVDQTLPDVLQRQVGAASWGFITAWNPLSEAPAASPNLAAQRALFADLQALGQISIFAAIGIGIGFSGWHEPSLFVIGPEQQTLDTLARRYRQHAYVCGRGAEPAHLRVVPD
jgi:hypothetical protein